MVQINGNGHGGGSNGDEIASSVSHGIGAGLSIAALTLMVTLALSAGGMRRVVSVAIYGAALVLLYVSSLLYHSFRSPAIKRIFRYFDHSAIFLLIAGTYTPFTLVSLKGVWGWALFGLIWTLALLGIAMTVFLMGRSRALAGVVYIGMGWLVILAVKPLMAALPPGGIAWLLAGGLLYSGGVAFYLWKRLPFNHTIWHLFVLAGSICHFVAVLLYVIPAEI